VIDPRLLHQVTVEMTTGFLVLAGLAVMAKLVADGWTRRLAGRSKRLDGWAAKVAAFAEPASFVALFAGVLSAFVTMFTGSQAWSAEELIASPTVHNKLLLVGLSQTLFIGALAFRLRFGARIWSTAATGTFYGMLVLLGNAVMVVQNSVGGHLAAGASLLDDVLRIINLDETVMWVFPTWFALGCLVAFPLAIAVLGARLHATNKIVARYELEPLVHRVRRLLDEAKARRKAVHKPLKLIRKAHAAVRRQNYVRAVRLLTRAMHHLAMPLEPSVGTPG